MDVKKILNIVKSVLVWCVVAVAVFMMIFTLISVNTFDKTDRDVFGYKFYTVLSDSMSATDFSAGAIVFVKEVDASTLKEGDIISYLSLNADNYGEVVTHKIRKLTNDATGAPGFITYGTTTGVDDEIIVTYEYVLGIYKGHIPGIGHFFQFLKTTPGYIICILVPFLILILSQGINCISLFRKYKKEQMEEMQAERDKIEEERAESQRMMAELMALKAQMAAQAAPADATPAQTAQEPTPEQPVAENTSSSED